MKYALIFTGCLIISGCMQAEDPKNVAQQYWQAMQVGNYAKARSLVSADSQGSFDDFASLPDSHKPGLSAVALTDSHTTVTTIVNNGNTSIKFDTVLVMQNGQWVIDAEATQIPPPRSALEQRMHNMAEQLSTAVDENMQNAEEALGEGVNLLNDLLQSGAQDLSESVNQGMNELNDSIHDAMRKLEQQRKQHGSTQTPAQDDGPI